MNCIITGKLINPSTLVVVSQSTSLGIPVGNYHVESLMTVAQVDKEISDLHMEVERLEKQLWEAHDENDNLKVHIYRLENNPTT